MFFYDTIRKNVLTLLNVAYFIYKTTSSFFYGVFGKIYLLHHPPPLSMGENTNIFYSDSKKKILYHLPPLLVVENTTTFSTISLEKTC
jgi:hypothetical protein